MSRDKINKAIRVYQAALDTPNGVKVRKRGGQMQFGNTFDGGGGFGYQEVMQNSVYEPEVDALIQQYWNQHPFDFTAGKNMEGFTGGLSKMGTTLSNFGKSDPSLGKNVNMSTPWSAIAGTAGSLTVDLQRAIDDYIRSKDKHIYDPMHSAGLYARGGNKFEGGGFSSNPMDIGNSFLKIASNAVNQGSLTTDYDTFEDALDRYNNNQLSALNNVSDNDALMMAYASHGALTPDDIRARDFRDKTILGDITDGLASSFEGFNATGNWIGAVVGGVSSNVGSIIGRIRAANAAKRAKEAAGIANRNWDSRFFHMAQEVDEKNDARRLYDYYNHPYDYALGGQMRTHGQDWNNGLTFIDAGGRHEDNPYEGVPSGVDEQGVPNLVEEGETIWNNEYVFSDRLKIPAALAKKYKLGGDLTFSEAIKKVTAESLSRPNDPISNETNRAIVNEFMDAQEVVRGREQQRAARQVQRAYDEDFMEQMDALGQQKQMVPPQGGINYQAPAMAQEGMPIGFAMGGNKFEDGSWKNYVTEGKDKSGTPIFTTSDGRVFYSEAGARKYVDLNKEYLVSRLPDFVASPAPARVVADASRQSLPAGIKAVYSKGRNGQRGAVHHYETSDGLNMGTDLDKAIRHQNAIDGVNAPSQEVAAPVVQEPAVPALPSLVSSSTVPASTVTATRTLPAAQPQVQQVAQPQVAAPQVQPEVTINSKGQEEETLPDGIKVVYSKGRNGNRGPVHHYETSDGLNMGTNRDKAVQYQTRLNQENAQVAAAAKAVPSPSFQDINIFGTPDGGFDLFSYAPQDYVSAPVAQAAAQPQDTSVPTEEQAAAQAAAASASSGSQASGKPSGRASGSGSSTGRMRTPSGETIDYRRDLNGKEWEANEGYQNFLSYMRGKGADDKEVKEWMDYIQNAIKESGSKYELKGFDDWSHLAEDGKVGPVHQATLKAAQYFAKRRGLTAVDPTSILDKKPNDAGKKPASTADSTKPVTADDINASIEALNGATGQQSPSFKYRSTWERDVPIWGAGAAALYGMTHTPDYSNADAIIDAARMAGVPVNIPVQTIGDYRIRKPYDERYLVNMANQNRAAATRGIVNTSGGNRAMDLLANASLAHSNQQDLGEIMRQAYLANRQDDAQVAEFNRGTNLYNMNAINQRNATQAHLNANRQQAMLNGLARGYGLRQSIKDAWDEATMESLNSMLASIGAKGKENEEYNMLTSMAENGYFPYYYGDRGIMQFAPATKVKNGGNKKKRRF